MDETIDTMDGVTMIINDHRVMERLFDAYEAAGDRATRLGLAAKISEEMALHATAEEHALYPTARRVLDDGEEVYEHSLAEHQEARAALEQIETTPVDDPAFDERVRSIIDAMRHHHGDEEEDLLEPLRAALDEEGLLRLGREIRRAKRQAPVRPTASERAGATTRDELHERAQALDLEGRSTMSKAELSQAIEHPQ